MRGKERDGHRRYQSESFTAKQTDTLVSAIFKCVRVCSTLHLVILVSVANHVRRGNGMCDTMKREKKVEK